MREPDPARKLERRITAALISVFACLFLVVNIQGQTSPDTPLTNSAVVKLVKAGFKEKTIVAIIQSRPNQFKLDPEQLIELKRAGVNETIILVMLSQNHLFSAPADEWDDDEAFFRESTRPQTGNSGGTNIFGSGSGSKTESKSQGIRGGNQSEGNIGGSATVRIIRPPSEGGAPGKLERTPALNNEEVIRLVEAGFSEGTIIKRIESSPVNFDLSPAKVEELQKRRVTDPIIAAMTAAMGEPTSTPATQPQKPF